MKDLLVAISHRLSVVVVVAAAVVVLVAAAEEPTASSLMGAALPFQMLEDWILLAVLTVVVEDQKQ